MSFSVLNYHNQASFTVSLGSLIENGYDIGLTAYPIFDDSYRETLNAKIKARYWFREIGQETPALFKHFLNRKMNEIMPYYNELYRAIDNGLDLASNVNLKTESTRDTSNDSSRNNLHNETTEGTANASSDTDSTARTVNSTTPQMQLSGRDDYASSLTDSSSNTTSSSSSSDSSKRTLDEIDKLSATGTENYIQKVTGLTGITGAQAFAQLLNSYVNIDVMILEELAPLFFGLYSNYENML